jgi:hypothetical protein
MGLKMLILPVLLHARCLSAGASYAMILVKIGMPAMHMDSFSNNPVRQIQGLGNACCCCLSFSN